MEQSQFSIHIRLSQTGPSCGFGVLTEIYLLSAERETTGGCLGKRYSRQAWLRSSHHPTPKPETSLNVGTVGSGFGVEAHFLLEARKKVLFTWPWPHFLEVSLSSGRGPYAGFRRGAWLLLRVPSCGPQL